MKMKDTNRQISPWRMSVQLKARKEMDSYPAKTASRYTSTLPMTMYFIRLGMPNRGCFMAKRSTAAHSFLKWDPSRKIISCYDGTLYPQRGEKS